MVETNVQTAFTPPPAAVRTSRLFGTGLSPDFLFIVVIDTRNNENVFALKLPRHMLSLRNNYVA